MMKVAQGWVLSWAPPSRWPNDLTNSGGGAGDEMARAEAQSGERGANSTAVAAAEVTQSSSAIEQQQQQQDAAAADQLLSLLAYSIELKEKNSPHWLTFATSREQSYLLKDLRPGAEYQFRVTAHTPAGLKGSPSQEFKYQIADTRRKPGLSQAFSATVTSGLLFFIACIVIAVCGVNMCNKRRKKRAEKGEC